MAPSEAWKAIRRRRPFIQPTLGQQIRLEEFAARGLDFWKNFDVNVEHVEDAYDLLMESTLSGEEGELPV